MPCISFVFFVRAGNTKHKPEKESEGSMVDYGQRSREKKSVDQNDYQEEIAAEIISPYDLLGDDSYSQEADQAVRGNLTGYIALFLSILSFFIFPLIFGLLGIVVGFIAQRNGAISLGAWAVFISTLSIILSVFVIPAF
ncbi:MAG: DUF4190 domain-containing protein [Bacillus sp. (in: firmicutes)]